jgi:hypothetical protein
MAATKEDVDAALAVLLETLDEFLETQDAEHSLAAEQCFVAVLSDRLKRRALRRRPRPVRPKLRRRA